MQKGGGQKKRIANKLSGKLQGFQVTMRRKATIAILSILLMVSLAMEWVHPMLHGNGMESGVAWDAGEADCILCRTFYHTRLLPVQTERLAFWFCVLFALSFSPPFQKVHDQFLPFARAPP